MMYVGGVDNDIDGKQTHELMMPRCSISGYPTVVNFREILRNAEVCKNDKNRDHGARHPHSGNERLLSYLVV
jgi:hypothetical protein